MYRHDKSHAAGMGLRHLSLSPTPPPQLLQLLPLPHSMFPALAAHGMLSSEPREKPWRAVPKLELGIPARPLASSSLSPAPVRWPSTRSGTAAYGRAALACRIA